MGGATKTDEFLEKFQTAFDPPPSLLENYIANFYDRYGSWTLPLGLFSSFGAICWTDGIGIGWVTDHMYT